MSRRDFDVNSDNYDFIGDDGYDEDEDDGEALVAYKSCSAEEAATTVGRDEIPV